MLQVKFEPLINLLERKFDRTKKTLPKNTANHVRVGEMKLWVGLASCCAN